MVAFYFFADIVILLFNKKFNISFIIPYLCTGIAFLPWLILMFVKHTTDLTQYWAGAPSIKTIISTIKFIK